MGREEGVYVYLVRECADVISVGHTLRVWDVCQVSEEESVLYKGDGELSYGVGVYDGVRRLREVMMVYKEEGEGSTIRPCEEGLQ